MTDASEGPTPAAAQQTPTISSVSVALAPPKSALRNEKRILRRLRVQILDCRSGEAIRNRTLDEVLIDGEEALRFPDAPEWDIAENEYISSKTWKPSALARALDALGYEPPERVSRWHHLDAALQAYRRDEEGLDEGDELPKISKKKLRRKWGKAALAEYRRNYFEAVQQHLTGLGFPCNEASDDGKLAADEPGSWGKKSKFEYKRWQRLELGRRKPAAWPTNAKRAKELVDGRHRFKSDAKGVVHIPIPVTKFADGFKLRFSLAHFPLVREELKVLERAESSAEERNQGGVPTGFGIEWHDSQDLAAELGPFGWRVRTPAAAETETSELPEFQRSIEVEFPKSEHKSFRKLAGEKPELFQKFYGQGPREAELVVFALVWAQPVYTEFENPPAGTRVDENGVYIQHDAHRPKGLQIVTMKTDLGGSALFGGKGYGVFERVLYQRWRGKTIEVLPALLRMRELGLFPKTIPSTCVAADPPSSGEAPVFREGEGESVSSLTPKELLWTYQTYRKTKEPSMAWIDEAIRAYQKPFYERDVARRVKKKHQHHMNGELHNKTRKMLGRELDGIRSDRFKDRRWGHAGYDLHVKAGNRWAGGEPGRESGLRDPRRPRDAYREVVRQGEVERRLVRRAPLDRDRPQRGHLPPSRRSVGEEEGARAQRSDHRPRRQHGELRPAVGHDGVGHEDALPEPPAPERWQEDLAVGLDGQPALREGTARRLQPRGPSLQLDPSPAPLQVRGAGALEGREAQEARRQEPRELRVRRGQRIPVDGRPEEVRARRSLDLLGRRRAALPVDAEGDRRRLARGRGRHREAGAAPRPGAAALPRADGDEDGQGRWLSRAGRARRRLRPPADEGPAEARQGAPGDPRLPRGEQAPRRRRSPCAEQYADERRGARDPRPAGARARPGLRAADPRRPDRPGALSAPAAS